MIKDRDFEIERTNEIVCPYCGYEHRDSGEYFYNDNSTKMECENCNKEFEASYDNCSCYGGPFTSSKINCKDKGRSHKWKFDKRRLVNNEFQRIKFSGDYWCYNYKGEIERKWYNQGDYESVALDEEDQYEQDWYTCTACDDYKIVKLDKDGKPEKKVKETPEAEKSIPEDKSGTISMRDSKITITTDVETGNYHLWKSILNMLKRNGYSMYQDPMYSDGSWGTSFNKTHRAGHKGELKFHTHQYSRGMEFEFWQDLVIEEGRTNGERHSFNKRSRMPYLIDKQMELTWNKIIKFLQKKYDFKIEIKVDRKDAEAFVIEEFNRSSHYPQRKGLASLSEIDGTFHGHSTTNCTDRDGKLIRNGDTKYFRDRAGYLKVGKVYHNLNASWYVIGNDGALDSIQAYDLFYRDANEQTKLHPDSVGERHIKRLESELKRQSAAENYERCIQLRDKIKKLKTQE